MNGRWLRQGFLYLLVLVAIVVVIYSFLPQPQSRTQDVGLATLVQDVRQGQVGEVTVSGSTVSWKRFDSDQRFRARLETGDTVRKVLQDAGIPLEQQPVVKMEQGRPWESVLNFFIQLLPVILIIGILFLFLRQAQGTNSQALNFGRSRARLINSSRPTITFADVAGVDEAKEELKEVVEFLKYPEKFASLGARVPKGVLLVGPPGTGKTLLAKAVAGEAGVPFFSISGSEFVEMFVGVGAARVRDLFDQAKRNSPCIIFIDEIDAVGRHRGAGLGGSHDEREQTLNQILVEMDGFDTSTNVIVMAATNRPDILDPALLRPGRFDRSVVLDRPDVKGRRAILEVHARGKPLDKDVDLEVLAKQTPGFSGADLANLVNEAAILAARRGKRRIGMAEFNEAVDRVIAGPERKSRVMGPRERQIVAYHEAGHALVAHVLPHADPPYKISIVARGMAGGFTRFLPEEDRHLYTKSQFRDMLASMLGGLVAEELVFGEFTTGPQDDLERATRLARQMVTQFGMSERLGPRTFGRKEELIFLGKEIAEQRNYSEKIAEEIDEEVRQIIDHAYHTARRVLQENRAKLDQLVQVLLEKETVEGEELKALLEAPPGQEPALPPAPPPPAPRPEGEKERERAPTPQTIVQPRPGLAFEGGSPMASSLGDGPA
jgi:cell division protease FtsH